MKKKQTKDKELAPAPADHGAVVTIKPTKCPSCNQDILGGAIAHGSTEPPKVGSVAVCMACGELCVFIETMDLRVMTGQEQNRLPFPLLLEMLACQNKVRLRNAREKIKTDNNEQSFSA